MAFDGMTYDDGCRNCGKVPTVVKMHESLSIQYANSSDSFGPFEADSYFCNECFTRVLQGVINRIE